MIQDLRRLDLVGMVWYSRQVGSKFEKNEIKQNIAKIKAKH